MNILACWWHCFTCTRLEGNASPSCHTWEACCYFKYDLPWK